MKSPNHIFALSLLCLAASASATERNRENLVINKIMPISGSRIDETQSRNIIRVYIQETTWEGGCRTSAFDIRKDDSHLYAAVLTAMSTGAKLAVTVDDRSKPVDDVCQAINVGISP